VATDRETDLKSLDATLTSVEAVLDVERMRREIADLESQASAPDLWDEPERGQQVTSRLSAALSDLDRVTGLRRRLDDVGVLYELAADESDRGARAEADTELDALTGEIGALEVRTLLAGPYDERGALVTINSQAGGVDAADWAQMLLRMYLRWSERRGYDAPVLDTSYAEEAGIKSATFEVDAPYAYGTLAGEHGVHRLVRISPFDNQSRRHTSFAGVDVVPVVEQADRVDIPESDVRVDVFRSSGPGGQSVNTTDSAVRVTHVPTGIVVSCQNEKSQIQNRAAAMRVLQARLLERRRAEQAARMSEIRGESTTSWGNQIRNYVLAPYQLVKDVRTDVETGNVQAVLDGDLDDLIEAEIRWRQRP
jgi:peptide chain release factor 2